MLEQKELEARKAGKLWKQSLSIYYYLLNIKIELDLTFNSKFI